MKTLLLLSAVFAACVALVLATPGDVAIAWEAEQFQHTKAPYAGLCLGFVKDAYAHAGVSKEYLNQGSAAEATRVAARTSGWHSFSDYNVPRGAVLLWENCSAYGHAALSTGSGYASSSGTGTNWDGSPHVTIEWLSTNWCGGKPNGWIMPY